MVTKLDPDESVSINLILNILGVLFTILLFLGCFALGAKSTLLDSGFYQRILTNNSVYNQLPDLLAQTVNSQSGTNSVFLQKIMAEISPEETSAIMQMIVPPTWIEEQVQGYFLHLSDFLNLKSTDFSYSIDLGALKEGLSRNNRTDIARSILDALPDCTTADAAKLAASFLQKAQIEIPACKPPEPIYSLAVPLISNWISKFAQSLPAAIQLPRNNPESNINYRFVHTYQTIRILLGLVPWGIIVCGLCLLAVGIVGYKRAYKVMGNSAFIAGISAILGSLFLLGFAGWLIQFSSKKKGDQIFQFLYSLFGEKVLMGYGKMVILYALGCIGVGLIILLLIRSKGNKIKVRA